MKKQEFNQLVETVIETVKISMKEYGHEDDILFFEKNVFRPLRELPNRKKIIETLQGILGFKEFLLLQHPGDMHSFVMNAIHDIREVVSHWSEEWFRPRLVGYSKYYKK